ncbi:MAG: right-handed parallel beta-helix repeat-containing protein [Bacteroidota bacterium]|nr:right-handed parallel beta-helix repeat-containing protein [Bacteroidota bacterium]
MGHNTDIYTLNLCYRIKRLRVLISGTFLYCMFLVLIFSESHAQLSGTKTIGGTSPDYATFSDAVTDLNSSGVGSGGVIFLFRDGTYTGDVEITATGTASDPIVFKSESEDSTAVTISLDAYDDVITLTGSSYISFEHLTIHYLKTSSYNAIEIGTSSNNVSIKNCIMESEYASTSNGGALIYGYESSDDCSNLIVENCHLIGGSYGIYFNMGNDPAGPVIRNNTIENFYYKGIELADFTAITIEDNAIFTNSTYSSYGIDLASCSGSNQITGNYIYTTGSGEIAYGIQISSSSSGTSGSPAKLYNNSIQIVNGSSTAYAIDHGSGCDYWDVFNNTIYVSGGTASSTYGYRSYASNANIRFKNNVIANFASGSSPYTIYVPNTGAISEMDNNCYYTNSGTNFYGTYDNYGGDDFSLFTDDTGEANSLNIDPEFEFVTDVGWKAAAPGLSGAGAYLSDVTSDIDGSPRPNPPSIGAHELASAPPDDAGILSIDAPSKPFSPGSNDVFVTLKNFGSDPLTLVTIEWEVNSSPESDFSWSGNLASGAETLVNIGSYNFIADVVYTITARTDLPNGNTDGDTGNDETSINDMRPGLSGTYTTGSGEDFDDFTATISALENYGVSGAVVFEIVSGTYNEQITISDVPGNSSANTITFQSQSGNAGDVTLTSASDYTVGSSTLELASSKNTLWQNMTMERTDSKTYANVVIISGESQDNTFDNVIFSGIPGSFSYNAALVFSDDENSGNSGHAFLNCTFYNGSAGIWFDSNSSNYKSNLSIENCHFENYRYGLILQYIENATIDNNTIINAASYNSAATTGIDLSYVNEILLIRKNEIIKTEGTSNYGIHMMACVTEYSGPNDPGEISNNMIVVGGTGSGTSVGIYTNGSKNKNFYFNSIYTTGANATTSKAMYVNGPYSGDPENNANFIFKNNVFMADEGIPLYNSVGGIIECDYNNYHAVNNAAIVHWDDTNDVGTIADLQAANADDANSMSDDPLFVSGTDPFDLHITEGSPCIDAATAISGITDDIDGDARNPDIGADELDSSLPVEWLDFIATCEYNKIQLSWTTATETNNDYFVVQSSDDANEFHDIGIVNGAGSSAIRHDYEFTVETPEFDGTYFRIKQVDYDGKYNYSEVIHIVCENDYSPDFKVYPNPIEGRKFTLLSGSNLHYIYMRVFDVSGQLMFEQQIHCTDGKTEVTLSQQLNPGMYVLVLEDKTRSQHKIKQLILNE